MNYHGDNTPTFHVVENEVNDLFHPTKEGPGLISDFSEKPESFLKLTRAKKVKPVHDAIRLGFPEEMLFARMNATRETKCSKRTLTA